MKSSQFVSSETERQKFSTQYIDRTIVTERDESETYKLSKIYTILNTPDRERDEFKLLKEERDVNRIRNIELKIKQAKKEREQEPKSIMECVCIKVLEEDGMSWSSQAVFDIVNGIKKQTNQPNFNIFTLQRKVSNSRLPVIGELLGRKKFLRLATKYGIVQKPRNSTFLKYFLRAILSVSGALIVENIHSSLVEQKISTFNQYFEIGLLVFLGITITMVLDRPSNGEQKEIKEIDLINDELEEKLTKLDDKESMNFKNFVSTLTQSIANFASPAFFILDNYENFDFFTKKVIEQYFEDFSSLSKYKQNSEYWVSFEPSSGEGLSKKRINFIPNAGGKIRMQVLEQIPLTDEEKRQLVNINKLENEDIRVNNTTVKAVVFNLSGFKWITEKIKLYKKNDLDNSLKLKMLTLLSVTSLPKNVELDTGYMTDMFKDIKESKSILQYYLYGDKKETWPDKIDLIMPNIYADKYLGKMVVERKQQGKLIWSVTPETANKIEEMKEDSEMGNLINIAHIFWAIFWHIKLRGHVMQTGWFKKLSYHLCELQVRNGFFGYPDTPKYGLEARDKMLKEVFESSKFSILGCIRSCLFNYRIKENDPNSILVMLRNAYDIIEQMGQEQLKVDLSYELLYRCWQVYYITLNKSIVELIININRNLGTTGNPKAQRSEPDLLTDIFFGLIPLGGNINRANEEGNIALMPAGGHTEFIILQRYMKLQSLWILSALISSLSVQSRTYKAISDLLKNNYSIYNIFMAELLAELKDTNLWQRKPTQLMFLSLIIWTRVIHFELNNVAEIDNTFLDNLEVVSKIIKNVSNKRNRLNEALVENEDFLNGILREISVLITASIAAHIHFLNFSYITKETANTAYCKCVLIIRSLDYYVEEPDFIVFDDLYSLTSQRFVENVDDYFEDACMYWKKRQMNNMHNLITAKRVQFNSVCTIRSKAKQSHLAQIIGTIIEENPLTELLVLFSKINFGKQSKELRAKFLYGASMVVNDKRNNFGKLLKEEISILIFFNSIPTIDLTEIGRIISEGADAQGSVLFKFLSNIPADELVSELNGFFNQINKALTTIKDEDVKKQVNSIVKEYIQGIQSEEARTEVLSLFEYFEFRAAMLEVEKLNTAETLTKWSKYKNAWYYPVILNFCISYGEFTQELQTECNNALAHDPEEDSWNSTEHLASAYLLYIYKHSELSQFYGIPLKYLKGSIHIREGINSAQENILTYALLEQYDKENSASYQEKIDYWNSVAAELKKFEEYLALYQKGNYFNIFTVFFERFKKNGLKAIDFPNETYNGIPVPICTAENGGGVVNSLFIEYGNNIIISGTPKEVIQLNNLANMFLSYLIDVCLVLPNLTKQTKNFLTKVQDHRSSEAITLPAVGNTILDEEDVL